MKTENKLGYKVLVVTFLLLANVHHVIAQQMGRIGFKGGLNATKLYIDRTADQNALIGFHGGVFGQFLSSKKFALQVELLYSTKGYKAIYTDLFNQEVKYNLDYFEVPVMAVIKLGGAGEIHLGGYVSYLLNAKFSYAPTLAISSTKIGKEDLKSFDYGLLAGMGINFRNFQVGARYNVGLVALTNSDAGKGWLDSAKNSCAQVFVAFNLVSR